MADYCPALPPGFGDDPTSKDTSDSESDSSSNSSNSSGEPSPKKGKKASDDRRVIGPVLPPGLLAQNDPPPPDKSDDDDEDYSGVGPSPFLAAGETSGSVAAEFEQRAMRMKDKLLNKHTESEVTSRETWMTELPAQVANAFAGKMPTARKLTAGKDRATEEERAEWTDTPADRVRKEQEKREGRSTGVKRKHETPVLSERDRLMAEKIDEYNLEKRPESLLEMHTKKIHKKEKKEKKKKSKSKKDKKKKKHKEKDKKKDKSDSAPKRTPFDRDRDLQVNRFDDAQRKLMIKKSAELNTKFGNSSGQKFL